MANREEWNRLDRWIRQLPDDLVQGDPELLILQCWISESRFRYAEMLGVLAEAESLIDGRPADASNRGLDGELDVMRSFRSYPGCDGLSAVAQARRALGAIPPDRLSARGAALLVLAIAHQMTGELELAEAVSLEALQGVRLEDLRQTVRLAHPRGLVRPFVDFGADMARLLGQLDGDPETRGFVGKVLTSFPDPPTEPRRAPDATPLVEPLTHRELEILGLLAERRSNKEIAAGLFISPVTVKRHVSNIFEKLQVHRRRDAVTSARSLGIPDRG